MTYYAVIDTNVLVSALLSSHENAATVQVVSRLFSGDVIPVFSDVIPVFSDDILAEYNEVLRRKKFNFSEDVVRTLLDTITSIGESITPSPSGEDLPDMKDLPFYEVVLEKEADNAYLITGNIKHFPDKPNIVTAREFLTILEA